MRIEAKPLLISLAGFGVVAIMQLALASAKQLPALIAVLPYFATFCCGAFTGYSAHSRPVAHLLVLSVAISLGFALLNWGYSIIIGPTDFPSLLAAGMALPIVLVLCFVGGAIGGKARDVSGA